MFGGNTSTSVAFGTSLGAQQTTANTIMTHSTASGIFGGSALSGASTASTHSTSGIFGGASITSVGTASTNSTATGIFGGAAITSAGTASTHSTATGIFGGADVTHSSASENTSSNLGAKNVFGGGTDKVFADKPFSLVPPAFGSSTNSAQGTVSASSDGDLFQGSVSHPFGSTRNTATTVSQFGESSVPRGTTHATISPFGGAGLVSGANSHSSNPVIGSSNTEATNLFEVSHKNTDNFRGGMDQNASSFVKPDSSTVEKTSTLFGSTKPDPFTSNTSTIFGGKKSTAFVGSSSSSTTETGERTMFGVKKEGFGGAGPSTSTLFGGNKSSTFETQSTSSVFGGSSSSFGGAASSSAKNVVFGSTNTFRDSSSHALEVTPNTAPDDVKTSMGVFGGRKDTHFAADNSLQSNIFGGSSVSKPSLLAPTKMSSYPKQSFGASKKNEDNGMF